MGLEEARDLRGRGVSTGHESEDNNDLAGRGASRGRGRAQESACRIIYFVSGEGEENKLRIEGGRYLLR